MKSDKQQRSEDLASASSGASPEQKNATVARMIRPAEHTPLPWEWWTSNSHARLTSAVTRSDGDVLSAYVARDGHPCINVRQINQEYIAHACNAYPTLVATLRHCSALLDEAVDHVELDILRGELRAEEIASDRLLRELGELRATVPSGGQELS